MLQIFISAWLLMIRDLIELYQQVLSLIPTVTFDLPKFCLNDQHLLFSSQSTKIINLIKLTHNYKQCYKALGKVRSCQDFDWLWCVDFQIPYWNRNRIPWSFVIQQTFCQKNMILISICTKSIHHFVINIHCTKNINYFQLFVQWVSVLSVLWLFGTTTVYMS